MRCDLKRGKSGTERRMVVPEKTIVFAGTGAV
jgi:hypothetical protein